MTRAFLILLILVLIGAALWFLRRDPAQQLEMVDRLWGDGGAELAARDIPYGTGLRQRLDIWRPAGTATSDRLPVIVFIHGGSWASGARDYYGFAGRAYAEQGFVVAVIDYRLGHAGRFPAMLEDSAAAVAWVAAQIGAHGGDARRIALAGHSAGAYNAMMIALDRQWLAGAGAPADVVRGVAALAGPFDFHPFTSAAAEAAFGHVADAARTQPIRFVRGDAPPLWLGHGEDDTTVRVRNSVVLAEAVRAAGGVAQLQRYAGTDHADIVMALSRPFRRKAPVLTDSAAFLRDVTATGNVRP